MKPNFIGIGAVRGGSTWLHEVLKNHPKFYLPTKRKEVQFFTKYYDKGEKFYESFFPDSNELEKSAMHLHLLTTSCMHKYMYVYTPNKSHVGYNYIY